MLRRPARPIIVGAGVLGVVGSLAGCTAADPASSAATGRYVDGTYSADGSYTAPSGLANITVSIKITDDVVSWVHVAPGTFVGDPFKFQDRFAQAVPDLVIGKDLDDVSVSRVAGSSLTTQAFNQAIDKIKAEAQEAP